MSRCVVSLFAGVGGFDYGFEQAGYETVFQCEIDERCRNVLRRHFPTADQWGDIMTLNGEHIVTTLAARGKTPDVIIWGSPCQDLSVAGRGAGLGGARSGLYYEGIRIINEIRKATGNEYPRISVWENVAGALSSNAGVDFGSVLDSMAEAGALVIEWRLLDAQYFGIPQRRRRVFVVSVFDSATAARCPEPLLPVTESVQWNPATSTTPRQDTPSEIARRLRVGSGVGERGDGSDNLVVGHRMRGFGDNADDDTASAIKARDHKDATDLVVAENYARPVGSAVLGIEPVIAFATKQRAEVRELDDKAVALAAKQGTNQQTYIAFENSYRDGVRIATEDVSQTLSAKMGTGGNNTPMIAFSHTQGLSAQPMAVRRLTPVECERLMGWADGWTAHGADNETLADTHRYRMCGNGVASPVAQWIAEQLIGVLDGDIGNL